MNDCVPPTQPTSEPQKLDGSLSIAEIAEAHPAISLVAKGKETIKDLGKRRAQIEGLKPGGSSIRTAAMIEEIIDRLRSGETLTSILCDEHMPATSTLWTWRDADPELDERVRRAQAQGQHTLADLRLDIALGGAMSTGDARRDELVIKTIAANLAQRNRPEFGDRVQVDHASVTVVLPDRARDL